MLSRNLQSLEYSDRVGEMSTRKGHFCYEAIKPDFVLDQTEILSKPDFYVILPEENAKEEEYAEVVGMWQAAKCKRLRDCMQV